MLSLSFRCLYLYLYLCLGSTAVVGVVPVRHLVPVVVLVLAPHHQTETYPPPTHKQTHETGDTTMTETASTEAARDAGMQMLVDKMAYRA